MVYGIYNSYEAKYGYKVGLEILGTLEISAMAKALS